MKWTSTLVILSLLMAVNPALAETYVPRTEMMLRFDASQQKHPKTATMAIPILRPIVGKNSRPLSFGAMYRNFFRREEDSRNSKGKVILTIEVVRNDQVIWDWTKKDKVKYDRYTNWECGNCTHKLWAGKKFDGILQKGDLVLFHFTFKGLPRFEPGEAAAISCEIER